ncbi:hypothetical protein [Moraxella lacunata]|uniref:hypothetical protein n=1 Tax=Moraxella lacunata TaxID=477 RepID=UPI003EE16505
MSVFRCRYTDKPPTPESNTPIGAVGSSLKSGCWFIMTYHNCLVFLIKIGGNHTMRFATTLQGQNRLPLLI